MVLKIINATEVKTGTNILVDETPCTVKSIDISKTGKHGHAKCRIEAIGIIIGTKKVFVVPGHERLDVPRIDKRKSQVLSVTGDKASIMDLETYETLELPVSEELKEQIKDGDQVEYWDVEGVKIIRKRV